MTLLALLKTLHVLGVIVWIGGMAFSQFALRPALPVLEPPTRVRLMHGVFARFFAIVTAAGLVVVLSGAWMMGLRAQAGMPPPLAWQAMALLGIAMLLIFAYVRIALFRRLAQAVAMQDWPAGAAALAGIRRWIVVNLGIGLAIIVIVLGAN
jgi:uncharacterized membrane protein